MDGAHSGKKNGFKKKGKYEKPESTANEFFKGVAFYVGREGPELYIINTVEHLDLYTSTMFKNGSDVMKFLRNEKLSILKYLICLKAMTKECGNIVWENLCRQKGYYQKRRGQNILLSNA